MDTDGRDLEDASLFKVGEEFSAGVWWGYEFTVSVLSFIRTHYTKGPRRCRLHVVNRAKRSKSQKIVMKTMKSPRRRLLPLPVRGEATERKLNL